MQDHVFKELRVTCVGRNIDTRCFGYDGLLKDDGDSCCCRSYKTSINLYAHKISQSLCGSGFLRKGGLGSELDPGGTLANAHRKLEVSGSSVEESTSISSWTIEFTYAWKKPVSS